MKISNFIQSPLFNKINRYLVQVKNTEQIFLYAPYIKTKILLKLIERIENQITVITTWHMNDLISGSSELELYQFCKENNVALFIHNKIHLKVYSVNLESAIVTSANISHNGLMEGGNYEAGVLVDKLEISDRMYLEKIKRESTFVDDDIYQIYLEKYEKCAKQVSEQIDFEDPKIIPQKDNFLISELPMTKDVNTLVLGYEKISSGLEPSEEPEITACVFHDLANYNIKSELSKEEFLERLKIQFFAHPFIQRIDEFINPEAYFGSIKEWIQNNCTDVPVPSRRELTGNVQVLYEWFEELGNGKYVIDIPGTHSQRISKIL